MSSTKRLEWIDMVKGFAIICMLVSHAIPGYTNHLKNWITSFNMPLFFVISGYLKSKSSHHYSFHDLGSYLKKQLIVLGVPYFFFCMLYTFFMFALSFYSSGWSPETVNQLTGHLKSTFFFLGVQSMWYIPVYFYSAFIYDFFISRNEDVIVNVITTFLISILVLGHRLFSYNAISKLIGKVAEATVFMQIGRFMHKLETKGDLISATICLIVFSCLGMWNGFVSMNFEFGRLPILFLVNASILSLAICYLLKSICHIVPQRIKAILTVYGKYSIVVLVTNNIIIEILRLIDHKITADFFIRNGNIGYLLFALILILLEYLVILTAKERMGILFGKGKGNDK